MPLSNNLEFVNITQSITTGVTESMSTTISTYGLGSTFQTPYDNTLANAYFFKISPVQLENNWDTGVPGYYTVCLADITLSGYKGAYTMWYTTGNSNVTEMNDIWGTNYSPNANGILNGYPAGSTEGYVFPSPPIKVCGLNGVPLNNYAHIAKRFGEENTKMLGDQSTNDPYNPGAVSPITVEDGEDAASLWDDRVKFVTLYDTVGKEFALNYNMISNNQETPKQIWAGLHPDSTYIRGLQGNEVYVMVVLKQGVSITEDTTIVIDLDGDAQFVETE